MKLKKTFAAGLSTALLISSCLSVSAAPAAASGLTPEQINSLVLNVEAYKQAYPDLAAAFGNNTQSYIDHYLTQGIYEGRTKGALFDPLTYAEAYDDIKNIYGYDINALVRHYVNYGAAENRTMGTSHGYPDIAAAESSGLTRAYIPRASAAEYQNLSNSGGSPASSAGAASNPSAAVSGTGILTASAPESSYTADRWNYHHTTSIYHDDGKTLWRVEYYDENNKLKEYSSVTNVNLDTNSYTENIYSYDYENKKEVLERVDIYENGVLVSSAPGAN